ncbi:MAG: hypothetical protein RL095_770 [Verrucomicrobiota bacterium]
MLDLGDLPPNPGLAMIAVLQRCSRAAVISVGLETGCLVLLLGVVKGDDEADAAACNKMRPWQ